MIKQSHPNVKDLKGQRFGKLVVSEATNERYFSNVVWECLCDCGNKISLASNRLLMGNTQSCGCIKRKQLILIEKGLKYCPDCNETKGLSSFWKDSSKRNNGYCTYCIDCSKVYSKTHKMSDESKANSKVQRATDSGRFVYAKNKCKQLGQDWNLTKEEFTEVTNQSCFYCGGELPEFGKGLDRLDNDKGYSMSNIVPCCTVCNRVKGDHFTKEQMIELRPFLIKFKEERGNK